MNILIAFLVFTVVVVIHELGHFTLAKINGIEVTEFSVGMGPRLVTLAKGRKGWVFRLLLHQDAFEQLDGCEGITKYSWKLLPIGGSCMMLGEDEEVENPNAFNQKGVWARFAVIVAGPLFNFILAFFLALIVISYTGHDAPKVVNLEPGYPMEDAGILEGDKIVKVGKSHVDIAREITLYFALNPLSDAPVEVTYQRGEEQKTVSLTPKQGEDGRYLLGFSYGVREKAAGLDVVTYSVIEVKYWIKSTLLSLKELLTGGVSVKNMSGPVGIVNMIGSNIEANKEYGLGATLLVILNWSILLTANLGVMNLVPFPALDGGRLVFILIEAVRKKPVDQEKEALVNTVGFFLLMALMVFLFYNDIHKIL